MSSPYEASHRGLDRVSELSERGASLLSEVFSGAVG